MKDVLAQSALLNQNIKDSKEYKTYMETKIKLYEHPELCDKLKEFRHLNYDLQNQEGVNNYDSVTRLVNQYDDMLHNSVVTDFLKAEQQLCKDMQMVFNAITDGLEFDLVDE